MPNESADVVDGGCGGQLLAGTQCRDATTASVDPSVINEIRELQAKRVATMRTQFRIDNAIGAFVRRRLGWQVTLPEAERRRIRSNAASLIKAINLGEAVAPDLAESASACEAFIQTGRASREPWTPLILQMEKRMRHLARSLPVYPWVESVCGASSLGLAIIVAEAGHDLSDFANPGKLWKRIGLAPGECYRAPTKQGEMVVQKPKRRRSAIYTVADSLLKKDNIYQKVYWARKEYELANHPEWANGVSPETGRPRIKQPGEFRARRYAEKRFIKHLWQVWRKASRGEPLVPDQD